MLINRLRTKICFVVIEECTEECISRVSAFMAILSENVRFAAYLIWGTRSAMYVRVLGSIHLPYSFSSTYFQY